MITLKMKECYCKVFHWYCRKSRFGGYGYGGRTDIQTGVYCSKCHTIREVIGWQKAKVVKTDAQIDSEIEKYGREQLTPAGCWKKGKWSYSETER
jgi:hypothetical protein